MINKIENLSYKGNNVVAYDKQSNGLYFNVTEVTKACGKKPYKYFLMKRTLELMEEMSESKRGELAPLCKAKGANSPLSICDCPIHDTERGEYAYLNNQKERIRPFLKDRLWKVTKGVNGGTWVHYDILLDYASWVSHEFMMWVHKAIVKMELDIMQAKLSMVKVLPKPLTEYDYSVALSRLLSYCRIPCFTEYEIDSMDTSAKTRRYDMIVNMYGTKYAIELKLNTITADDIISIFSRHYISGMEQIEDCTQLVIMSPNGITKEALLLIDSMRDTNYQSLIDFSVNCDSYLNRYYKNKLMIHNIHRELHILYGSKYVKEL